MKISFAGDINRHISFGSNWSKYNEDISMGLLYRPYNFLSFGSVLNYDEELQNFNNIRSGIALRPFSNELLTFGVDYIYTKTTNTYLPFVELSLGKAVTFKSQFKTDDNNETTALQTSININLGKTGFFANTKPDEFNENRLSGLGYYETKKIKKIFLTK